MNHESWLKVAEHAVLEAPAGAPAAAPDPECIDDPPSLGDIARILRARYDPGFESTLFESARRMRERVFGRRVGLFAPLYYSNVCANDCLYCGYRRSLGSAGRRILSREQVIEEASLLLSQGHRRILLIASEDPTPRGLTLALGAVESLRFAARRLRETLSHQPSVACDTGSPGALSISLEMAPRSPDDFHRLKDAGVTCYVLFQETYDPALYPRVHPSGPKADFGNRLAGPLRAAEGGIDDLGLGVLYGLNEPVRETVAMVAHARHLQEVTGHPVCSVSVPRLEPAHGVPFTENPPFPLTDRLWLRIVAVLRLALPLSDVIVSTREGIGLRRASLQAGATVLSAGSRTDPGGYRRPGESREQFSIGDPRSLPEVIEDLRALGYEPELGKTRLPA